MVAISGYFQIFASTQYINKLFTYWGFYSNEIDFQKWGSSVKESCIYLFLDIQPTFPKCYRNV